MKPVATASEMRACDTAAIERYGIPGLVLMENAARGSADVIERLFPDLSGSHALIFCGKGNNGGDGFALARHLLGRGFTVTVASVGTIASLSGDARINADIIMKISRSDPSGRLKCLTSVTSSKLSDIRKPDLIVDALLGTGVRGKPDKKHSSLISWINACGVPTVAIDIPSGIQADSGIAGGRAVQAYCTFTMGLLKRGLLLSDGREAAGKTVVIDIQIPQVVYERSGIKTFLIEEQDIRLALPKRRFDVHKYSVGKVFVIAGSTGLTGAAALSSLAALKTGAGAVILGVPRSLYPFMAKRMTEVMTMPLAESSEGVLGVEAWDEIQKRCAWADAVALGPGLSKSTEIGELVGRIVTEIEKPLVIDADGINALAGMTDLLLKRRSPVVLTPHTGEFARLSGLPVQEINSDRLKVACDFASSYNTVLHLKGGPSITALQDKTVYINSTGNPGMATAGSGDVLTGIIAGLMAQGLDTAEATYCGSFIHGRAGDNARDRVGIRALTAGDIQAELPKVLKELEK
jgi:ADP-dependent NAD(P)H-hydrate dehydratase / NAD(P)H-hydrate epimerase